MKWILALIIFMPAMSFAKNCVYRLKKDSVKVEWTGYKFTNKTGVTGKFLDARMTAPAKGKSIEDFVSQANFKIKGLKFDAGNEARNINLTNHFFKHFAGKAVITGAVSNMDKGEMEVMLNVNGVRKAVPMKYEIKDKSFKATGKIKMEDFKLGKAYAAISKACKALHTGEDGVAKTWKEVDLMASADFSEECKK